MWPESSAEADRGDPFAPRLVREWLAQMPDERHRSLPGTMIFADISGFTRLTERLARQGRVGAELLSDTLDLTFTRLLEPAFDDDADLLKWGGDAVLLFVRGAEHAARAARIAHGMRAALRTLVRDRILPVPAQLRMSIGIRTGVFDMFFVGDPASHRELIVGGPDITRLVAIEQTCDAGRILVCADTADLLPSRLLGDAHDVGGDREGRMLRTAPSGARRPPRTPVGPGPSVLPTLPPGIRAQVLSGPGEPEHRPVAIGFVQFTGTDALLQDAERAADAVAALVETVQRACLRHGVTFFETDIAADGGKIMLIAGAPRSAGRDAARMLSVARQIADHTGPLQVRVGVSTGPVFAGELGPALRRAYSVKGDAVNLAARLLGRAQPGQVVATADAVSTARLRLQAVPIEPFLVKGKRVPVHALTVLHVDEQTSDARGETPFVGRSAEIAVLRAALAAASDHRGSVIDVVGEPGIGKTRLVAEAGAPDGIRSLVTSASGYEADAPYAAVGGLLRAALGIAPHDESDAVASRLSQTVHAERPDLLPWLPLIGVPLGVELPSTRDVDELDPRFRRGRIEDAVVALLASLLPAPTVLIFEDTHLLDEASDSLLLRLESEAHRHPWCVIATRREVPVGHVPRLQEPADRRIALAAMPHELARALVEQAAGSVRQSRHALEAIVERGQGNPLFLTSLATRQSGSTTEEELPGSVEAVLLVDIDRLDTADRALLRLAAVLGTRFDPRFLARLRDAGAETRLSAEDIADRLAEFVRPVDDGDLEFRHAMVRDVAYAGLPFRLRRRLHEQVALAWENAADQSSSSERLSLHFHAAGLHERAWVHSLHAGEQARGKYAYAQAAAFFARAIDAAMHLPQIPRADRAAAFSSLGDSLDMAGDATGALTALRRARRELAGDPVATGDLLYREARITQRLGRYRAAMAQLTRALRMLEESVGAEADAVRAQLATRYGFCLHLQSRARDAVRWSRLGVEWAEASGDRSVLAHACNALHLAYGASALDEDRPYGQIALGLYERLDDLSGQALTLNNLAIDAYNGGEWNDAISAFARSGETFRRLGDEANEATALYNTADVLVAQGRHGEALPVLQAALRLARRVDDEELVGLVLREQARAEAGVGDSSVAWPLFDEARAVLAGLELATEVALLDAARAEALTDAGDAEQALALIDDTIRAARLRAADTLARLHRIRAQVLVSQGESSQAAEAAREGLARTTGGYGGYEPALLQLALAEATGDDELQSQSRRTLRDLGVVV
ncbi:class 3 adenylate cyclase/tetratricopeptide (TPR) repeat protein [Microbacterium sp. W4I4]|uniref:adenylate/guanylate cyclase domain-containing protein n=1 Tax=Microbacterium sp. W4I4 TaxID=3042295 RepID=UPI00277FA59A|nr:adenylate/guanylate cyclase domain-containing protein [Microbacterium sp. W4I4]MDQ0615392.1 class 3 adenylate cyclase/tetratricopeptide (TPR) repeat protein [Microbacterium sp. W4I4]